MLGKHDFLIIAVEERELAFRMNDRERQARKPGPGANIQNALTLQQRSCDQTVEEVRRDHLFSVPDRRQIDFAIPPFEFVDQRAKLFRCIV